MSTRKNMSAERSARCGRLQRPQPRFGGDVAAHAAVATMPVGVVHRLTAGRPRSALDLALHLEVANG
jgi:hypothetical protein